MYGTGIRLIHCSGWFPSLSANSNSGGMYIVDKKACENLNLNLNEKALILVKLQRCIDLRWRMYQYATEVYGYQAMTRRNGLVLALKSYLPHLRMGTSSEELALSHKIKRFLPRRRT